MNKIKHYISAFGIFVGLNAFAQGSNPYAQYPQMYENQHSSARENTAVSLTAKDQIDISINRMMTDPVLRNAHWGFVIYDPQTRKVVNSYNATDSFLPASTTKLLTTETAFSLLGPKFRWLTQLEYSGDVDAEGNLNGNLYVVGSGDPTMGTGKAGASSYTAIISDFIYALANKGIKRINGNIVLQTAVFKENKVAELPENIVWLEQSNYYLPAGTTYNIDPRNEKIIVKQANPFQEEKRYFYVSPYNKKMVYADQFSGGYVNTKLPDAPNHLANSLRASLIKSGIPVTGTVTTKMVDNNPEKRVYVTAYKSPSLREIVYDTNQRSDNNLAEAILRMVGFQKAGDQSLDIGRNVVLEHLRNVNFDMVGLHYADGSGLSKSNYVSPMAQVKFLADLINAPYYKDFQESLPIAGQTGTLKKMFFGNSYGQIFAKTGTLNRVKCLAGYIKTRTGKTLTFSMLVNNYSGSVDQVKARMEELLDPAIDL